jgi:hypothetical protein
MATTTASITLSSADLLSNAISLSSTSVLYDDSSTATGLTQCKMGRVDVYVTGSSFDLIDATPNAEDQTQYVYIANKNTTDANYVTISIYNEVIGKLYAGDWMFIPWNADDPGADNSAKNDIEVEAFVGGPQAVEYAVFTETTATNLTASGD